MSSRQEVDVEQVGIGRLAGGFHLREGGEGCLASRRVSQTRTERLQRIPDARLPSRSGFRRYRRSVSENRRGAWVISQGYGSRKSAENLDRARRISIKEEQELPMQIIVAMLNIRNLVSTQVIL